MGCLGRCCGIGISVSTRNEDVGDAREDVRLLEPKTWEGRTCASLRRVGLRTQETAHAGASTGDLGTFR